MAAMRACRKKGKRAENKPADVLAMQKVLKATVKRRSTAPAAKAQCARAWTDLETLYQRLKGNAPLAPIKAEPKRKRAAPVVPLSEGPMPSG